jgi:putative ABC transport system permease protein
MATAEIDPRGVVERAYVALFRLLPAAFRARFTAEMLDFFRTRRARAASRGAGACVRFAVAAVADLVVAAWRERRPRPSVAAEPARPAWSGSVRDDLRSAARRFRRAPGLTLTVIGLLGLTIGSATVVFSVVNAVLLRPLPFTRSDRIVLVWETRANARLNNVGAHEYPVWARLNRSFSALSAIVYNQGAHLTDAGEPASLITVRVSEPFFRVMGVPPAIGRAFTTDEDADGHGQVAILSDRLWHERFGGDRSALGRDLVLDGRPLRIVGVMPPGFAFPPARPGVTPDVWLPMAENLEPQRGRHHLFVVGRLKDGTTIAQAHAEMSSIAEAIAQELPDFSKGHGVDIVPLQQHLVQAVKPSLILLFGSVGCLVLIGCSNVASLLLARGLARRREIGLEMALGATRSRIARQLLAESVAMSAAGGALGLAITVWLIRVVPALVPPDVLSVESITVDRVVLGFVAGISILTGLLFGLAPAIQLRRVGPGEVLKQAGRSLFGGEHTRLRRALVVAQIALAVLLVIGATLMARGLVALQRVDPGFVTAGTLSVDVTLRGSRYAGAVQQREFFDAVETAAAALPAVLAVGAIDNVPLSGGVSGIAIGLEREADRPGEVASAQYRVVSPGYFRTMGIRFIAGRDFSAADARLAVPLIRWWPQQPYPPHYDRPQPAPVAIVNESMARACWPNGALGRRFTVIASPPIMVIGVVADTHTVSLRTATGPEFYLTSIQEPQSSMNLLVRAATPPLDLVPDVRGVISRVDPALPIGRVTTLSDVVGGSFAGPRFTSTLLGVFAGLALLLMTVGVYGLLAFTTAQRLPEMGVRMALGAARGDIHRLIFRDAVAMTAIGVAVGVGAALALGRLIADQLYGITPTDRTTFLLVTTAVTAVVVIACWRPARRAAKVDPVVVLRQN